MRKLIIPLLIGSMLLGVFGCASMTRGEKGAVIGGSAGAVIGGIIGENSGNTAVGAIIGAAIGGAAGAYIGNYMDKQAAEIEADLEGATVERVGEGIKITFDSGILFEVNKADLSTDAKTNLENLSVILKKYEDTNILIEGHTDSDGSDEHNMNLSQQRAGSVSAFLASHEVLNSRLNTVGYGESQPIADNSTVSGKAANRRFEVAIMANDKLKKAAEEKTSQG